MHICATQTNFRERNFRRMAQMGMEVTVIRAVDYVHK